MPGASAASSATPRASSAGPKAKAKAQPTPPSKEAPAAATPKAKSAPMQPATSNSSAAAAASPSSPPLQRSKSKLSRGASTVGATPEQEQTPTPSPGPGGSQRLGRSLSRAASARGGLDSTMESMNPTPQPLGSTATTILPEGGSSIAPQSPMADRVPIGRAGTRVTCAFDYIPTMEEQYQSRLNGTFHRESSVNRLTRNPAVVIFSDWVQTPPNSWDQVYDHFGKETGNPLGGRYQEEGSMGVRGLPKKKFAKMVLAMGFPGSADEVISVWQEVAKEARPDIPTIRAQEEEEILLCQLKKFGRRIISVNCTLSKEKEGSPANRFIKLLKNKYGTILTAWRSALDVRGTGRVAFTDFTRVCRKLGLNAQGKLVWNNLRQDTVTPLELHELDREEGENLEAFAETLWKTVGLDLNKAWMFLDAGNLQYLSWADFSEGLDQLGFTGDKKLLFKGLDSSGVGRLKREDLEYVLKVTRLAQTKLGGVKLGNRAGQIGELITWAQRELGGAHELVIKLGLSEETKQINTCDLAARLTALGFEGDALNAANQVARIDGGTMVSAQVLYSLASGGGRQTNTSGPQRPQSARSPGARSVSAHQWAPRVGWSDSVDNISNHNVGRSQHTKGYFQTFQRDDIFLKNNKLSHSSSTGAINNAEAAALAGVGSRPGWERSTDHIKQENNVGNSMYNRSYFSDPSLKPVRDERRALLQRRRLQRGF